MKTLRETLQAAAQHLAKKQVAEPRRTAEEIFAFALKKKRIDLYLDFDLPLHDDELQTCRELIQQVCRGEPLTYAIGEAPFYGVRLLITRDVLIPRQETEILVDSIVKKLKGQDLSGKQFWDLCSGSGCIGIAVKKALPDLHVVLTDLSKDALKIAQKNAEINQVDVELREGDLLAPFEGEKAHFIACNPPYVSLGEYKSLGPAVRDWEPEIALLGGDRGTEFYERLASSLPSFLHPNAEVFLELGSTQGGALKEIFSNGPWAFELHADWAGRDRFFFLERQ